MTITARPAGPFLFLVAASAPGAPAMPAIIRPGDEVILPSSVCQPLASARSFRNPRTGPGQRGIAGPRPPSADSRIRSRMLQLRQQLSVRYDHGILPLQSEAGAGQASPAFRKVRPGALAARRFAENAVRLCLRRTALQGCASPQPFPYGVISMRDPQRGQGTPRFRESFRAGLPEPLQGRPPARP